LSLLAVRLHARRGALPQTLTEPVTVRQDHGRVAVAPSTISLATTRRRNVLEGEIVAEQTQPPTKETTKSQKEESDEALARYTLWLMVFTGVLAFATIGLGIATLLLYATDEK
jgi:hypothetical protein